MDTQRITQLVLEAQQGNRSALEALLESCYQDIYYFALKTVKSEDVAADVTQESCLEITKTISQLREPAAFAAWVRRITYHQCTRYFKKAKDVIPDLNEEGESIFDSLPDESQDTEPEAVYADKEFKATMLALVNSLSPEQSSALLLYYYEKMSVQQIAEIQGVPDGTVKSRLNYARKAFKQKVEEYENKTGVRLHAATPISILLAQLFKQGFAELTVPQITLFGAASVSASAGTAAAGATGASIGAGAVGNAMAGAAAATVSAGASAIGSAVSGTSDGSHAPEKPKAKTKESRSKKNAAASVATSKVGADKATTTNSNAGTSTPKNEKKSSSPIVAIICVLLITALLAGSAFIGVKFFMNDPSDQTPSENTSNSTDDNTSDDHNQGIEPHEHYTTEWYADDGYHYHECKICGVIMDKAAHQDSDWIEGSTLHYKHCDICGLDYQNEEHTSSQWQYNDSQHMKICLTCNQVLESGNHNNVTSFDENNHYSVCSTCQKISETAPHAFEWKYDRTSHYQICSCQKEINHGEHKYVNEVCACGRAFVQFDLTYTLNSDNKSYSVKKLEELNVTHVTIPQTYNGLPVTVIAESAFANYKQLKTVALPDSITRIEAGAFKNCSALSDINLDNVTYLGDEAFMGCSSLDSIDLPDTLTSMGQSVFRECSSLKSIVLPNDLEYLPAYSFYGCTSLTDVVLPRATVDLPEDRNDEYFDILNEYYNFWVGDYAFAECRNLVNVDVDNNLCGFGDHAFENCVSLKKLVVPNNFLPGAFMEIEPYTFAGCISLETIEHGEPFAVIREGAFSGCINLKSISIGHTAGEIQKDAFQNCPLIEIYYDGTSYEWHILEKSKNWGDPTIVVYCSDKDLDHLTYSHSFYDETTYGFDSNCHWAVCGCGEESKEWWNEPHNIEDRTCTVCGMMISSEGLEFELNATEDGYILIYLGECTDTEIYIPSMYNGLPVVGIGSSAFEGCSHITAIHIPDSVRSIGSGAFLGTSITEITIPDGVTVIADNTFGMCQNLVTVHLPESVKSIYMFAFSYCTSLAEINLGNIEYIGSFAFQNCSALTEVSCKDALIEDNAFAGSGVITVTLTGECEIYASVFMNCKSLTTVYLPASITYIDVSTFKNCTSLAHIYFDGTVEEWNSMDRMDYEEDMDPFEMELLWNHNTGDYVIHCTDGDLSK